MKLKFLKLRMIWNIIRGRTVVYKAEFEDGTLHIKNIKSIVVGCICNNSNIKTPKGYCDYG